MNKEKKLAEFQNATAATIKAIAADKLFVWLKTNPKTINAISACALLIIALVIALTQHY